MSVIDDGALTWDYQGYWDTNAGYCPAWLEMLKNLNQRCDFRGVARPTVPLMQPNPTVDPVSWKGLCSSAETPSQVFAMLSAMQTALNSLETAAGWCDSDGSAYSGFDLATLDPTNRVNLKAIVENVRASLDAHRYKASEIIEYPPFTGSFELTIQRYLSSYPDGTPYPPSGWPAWEEINNFGFYSMSRVWTSPYPAYNDPVCLVFTAKRKVVWDVHLSNYEPTHFVPVAVTLRVGSNQGLDYPASYGGSTLTGPGFSINLPFVLGEYPESSDIFYVPANQDFQIIVEESIDYPPGSGVDWVNQGWSSARIMGINYDRFYY